MVTETLHMQISISCNILIYTEVVTETHWKKKKKNQIKKEKKYQQFYFLLHA